MIEQGIFLSKGYLKSLLHYLYSVHDLGTKIKKLKDKRSTPKIDTAAIAFIHDEIGLEAAFGFLVIAFNFMQLFFFRCLKNFRQRRSQQVEVVGRIIKELHGFNAHGVYVFDTS